MTHFTSPRQRAWLNLLVTTSRSTSAVGAIFRQSGLTEQQYNVLRILRGRSPEPVNLSEIQERMIDKSSNATRLVEKLKQKGLADRHTCKENRRKVDITITDKGLKLLSDLDPKIEGKIDDLFRNLNDDEIRSLDSLLEKFRG
ncbi:MAG TPA: MarR family transcriptional regulator [Balneolales bacterium]|nr:MarR family transcriptional regulator [Balneolales bacterium]